MNQYFRFRFSAVEETTNKNNNKSRHVLKMEGDCNFCHRFFAFSSDDRKLVFVSKVMLEGL